MIGLPPFVGGQSASVLVLVRAIAIKDGMLG